MKVDITIHLDDPECSIEVRSMETDIVGVSGFVVEQQKPGDYSPPLYIWLREQGLRELHEKIGARLAEIDAAKAVEPEPAPAAAVPVFVPDSPESDYPF